MLSPTSLFYRKEQKVHSRSARFFFYDFLIKTISNGKKLLQEDFFVFFVVKNPGLFVVIFSVLDQQLYSARYCNHKLPAIVRRQASACAAPPLAVRESGSGYYGSRLRLKRSHPQVSALLLQSHRQD